MARPVDPRSRTQACLLIGVNEATVRKLEREGLLPAASEWTALDLVWAKVLATPGVRPERLPARPSHLGVEDVLIVPLLGPEQGVIEASLLQAVGTVDRLRDYPVAVLQVGRWLSALQGAWQ